MRELVPLAGIKRKARFRKPGYVEAYLTLGQLDESTGMVRISPENWLKIREQCRLPPGARQSPIVNRKLIVPGADLRPRQPSIASAKEGLGDRLHKVLGPIGRAIGWPCLKGDGTIDLKPGSPCDKTRELLNKL
jgi:hypothetical protein